MNFIVSNLETMDVDRGKRRERGPLEIKSLRGSWNQKREGFEAIGEKSHLASLLAAHNFPSTDCRLTWPHLSGGLDWWLEDGGGLSAYLRRR